MTSNVNAILAHFDMRLNRIEQLLTTQGTHPLDERVTYATDDEDFDR